MTREPPTSAVWLTILSCVEGLTFLVALFLYLSRIRHELEKIGNTAVHIQWGVRAIEKQTEQLPVQTPLTATQLHSLATAVQNTATHLDGARQHLSTTAIRNEHVL